MNHLPLLSHNVQQGTILHATAKSVAGRENPNQSKEPTHALAWFFVGARPSFLGALLGYLLGGSYSVMAVRAGQPRGWPGSFVSGFSPLSGLPPMSVRTPGGRDNLTTKEAAIMATVPTPVVFKTFTFLITHGDRRLSVLRYIRTIATSEALARSNHADLPLVFVSRIPIGRTAS
ncbi:host cell division inhibitor Icd-like protein [Aeromonas salmonicida]|uniref:host cell division inhibitor Icd-like protein n=1 Tax=Aeromonas salmonicida TaxID=645 RepID=UPI00073112D6|nr:host cell division inhibitor Icd-like protein [Aeromonas salmonicida]KTA75572.1 hypothetical protein VO68_15395 [Aeromonas salmonicida]